MHIIMLFSQQEGGGLHAQFHANELAFPPSCTGIFSHSCAWGFAVLMEASLAELLDLEIELGMLDLLSTIITLPH